LFTADVYETSGLRSSYTANGELHVNTFGKPAGKTNHDRPSKYEAVMGKNRRNARFLSCDQVREGSSRLENSDLRNRR